jgi:hypothetical protein
MASDEFVVDWPTLWVACDWIERHCVIPDGFRKGEPFEMYDWQLWCTANHYRVKPGARVFRDNGERMLAAAFHNRRSQVVAPQKTGKGPWTAGIVALEGAGPAVFDGWAEGGEVYDCRTWSCGCGWTYEYEPGEAMGRPWPTPLIQITAFSVEQTDNVYRPLQSMIRNGLLADMMKVGEEFIRIGTEGRIDVVTSSAQSRLGNPVTFVLQDESGIWTPTNKMDKVADTQRRGAAGMGGRTMETTNCWDPSENSVAQLTSQSKLKDIFKFHRKPPAELRYKLKSERRKIHAFVYAGSRHVDLDNIEGDAMEKIEKGEVAQAERFFGNRVVAGTGQWLARDRWDLRARPRPMPPRGTPVALGFDGSDLDDWTGIRLETMDGYQFTPIYSSLELPTIWDPAEWGGQVPRLEVDAAVDEIMNYFTVVRGYFDPPYWETEIDTWIERYGDHRVVRWYTKRPVQMHDAAERLRTDVTKAAATAEFFHDGCEDTSVHVGHARQSNRPGGRYVLAKPSHTQKIDLAVVSILTHEAAGDAIEAGEARPKPSKTTVYR